MLINHFGINCRIQVVGMNTGEFVSSQMSGRDITLMHYDVVFHGSSVYAKGIDYFVNLSLNLVEYRFFIPDSKSNVEKYLGRKIDSSNMTFKACDWESGLRDIVSNAKLVLVPSLWSAPIEGALVKSILFNGSVAVVKNSFGYSSEISDEAELLVLDHDIADAARSIREYLKSESKNRSKQKMWIDNFYQSNEIINLFNVINEEVS